MISAAPFHFSYELAPSWPRLAWAALCENGSSSIPVIHGPAVDRAENWFCEAVWDGPFSEGNLDQTDLVFGSGARCRRDGVTFVSSAATVDRLHVSVRGNRTFISNSLPCLLAVIGGRLDPAFRGYADLFLSVTRGLDDVPDLPIDEGAAVEFAYRTNLRWDGYQLHRVPKCAEPRNFSCFHSYVGFLRAALQRIGENIASPQRMRAYSWLGTISRGYDSPTCALLAREAGLRRVITIDESRPGVIDDGSDIALALGLTCVVVGRLAWTSQEPLEPLFLAADGQGKEIPIAGAAAELGHVVVVTGHGGDTAWSLKAPYHKYANPGTYSGMSMAEYRLHLGFIHMPCPFIGWNQLSDIVKISRSDEMTAWNIGGAYNRPICRRLLEEAGVPRGSFAVSKTGASIRFLRGEDAWSKNGRRAFLAWLRTRPSGYAVTRRLLIEARLNMLGLAVALRLQRRTQRFLANAFQRIAAALSNRIRSQGLDDLAFVWAIQAVRQSYSLHHHPDIHERSPWSSPS
jgi:hypothetical protein